MIIGIGSDLVDINRIKKSVDRFGNRFINRIFTGEERLKAGSSGNRIAVYAKRFAAKEAASKALGTGFRKGIFWKDLEVSNLISGQPTIIFHGNAKNHLESLMSKKKEASVNLTITDEYPYAHAIVVIESN